MATTKSQSSQQPQQHNESNQKRGLGQMDDKKQRDTANRNSKSGGNMNNDRSHR